MTDGGDPARQRVLIAALSEALEREHGRVECFETHISWVLVAGEFAYKFKKAVRFDFLDFSTLDARHFYCKEEVRINRRLAQDIYLGVLAVGGTVEHPLFAAGEAIEYCVQMRAFAQEALWTYRLQRGLLSGAEIDDLAHGVARFHLAAARASAGTHWGDAELVQQVAGDNLASILGIVRGPKIQTAQDIQAWAAQQHAMLGQLFAERKRRGFVREGHGDLHCGNIVSLDGRAQAFDCIEFNESLRWIDVINDIAFIYMDLRIQGRTDLAARCLNRYLETTGDYEGVCLLHYYQVQRALVRSKISLLRTAQVGIAPADAAMYEQEGLRYLEYAARNVAAAPAAIMITHGFSGCGKSSFARYVVECVGALQLRSDVERKRLHDATPSGDKDRQIAAGLYSEEATRRTYARLLELARLLAVVGMPVVVDAAFLQQAQRSDFMALAAQLGVPFVIFDLQASEVTMRKRVALRKAQGEDASDAGIDVLMHQFHNHDPLSPEELQFAVTVDAESPMDRQSVQEICDRASLCTKC